MSVLRALPNSHAPPTGIPNLQQGEGKSWNPKGPNSGESIVHTKGNRHLNDIPTGDRSWKQTMATSGWQRESDGRLLGMRQFGGGERGGWGGAGVGGNFPFFLLCHFQSTVLSLVSLIFPFLSFSFHLFISCGQHNAGQIAGTIRTE